MPDQPNPITIRRAKTPTDYFVLQEAQRRAWGLTDEAYVVPVATMVGAAHHGGLVVGAFLPDGSAVGLSFGFLGRVGDRSCLYSQLTGVVPGYQGRGIGAAIKAIQREHAAAIGLDFIAWAFDPLQAGNLHFNLRRLGAVASRYVENMYGPRSDALNAGAPTDRLIAEWPTVPGPPRSATEEEKRGWPRLVEGPYEPRLGPLDTIGMVSGLLVEIPAEIGPIRAADPARAERWRAAIARALTLAFAVGYRAADLLRVDGRSFIVLDQGAP